MSGSRFRRVLLWSPLLFAVLFMTLLGVQFAGGSDTTRILVMCTDDVDTVGLSYKRPVYKTDVMLVVEVDRKRQQVICTQIPRDTLAYISPEQGLDKVNIALSTVGADQSRKVVGNLIGHEIDHYIVIRVQDFLRFIDIIGGIEVEADLDGQLVSKANEVTSQRERNRRPIMLRGRDAFNYVWDRPSDDLERESRQRMFLNALLNQCGEIGVRRIFRLTAWVWNLDGNMSLVQMAQIGRCFAKSSCQFHTPGTASIYLNERAYLLPMKQGQGSQ